MLSSKWLFAAALSGALVACGGGGGSAGTAPFGPGAGGSTSTTTTSDTVSSNSAGTLVLSLSSTQVNASQPGTVTAVVKDASGNPVSGALVEFGLSGTSSSIASVSPASAITNSSGQAATTLTPSAGATSGAAYVTATATTSAGTLTTKTAFSVSATNVTLSSVSLGQSSIAGYGSTAVNFVVSGASSTSPVTVNVSSTCSAQGKATISPSSYTVTSGSGSVTYQDKACSTTDRISVQISGSTQQQSVDLTIAAPATQGIQFSSVDRSTICLKGSGCPSVANVTFKVVDAGGVGKSGVRVDFSLDSSVSSFADLGSTFGTTASDGTVAVAVASKSTPTPLRVTATVNGSSSISTVSNLLTISGGLPVAGNAISKTGISFAAKKNALNNDLDGDSSDLTVTLNDRYSAPVADGTAVSFVADGGTVIPAYCTTTSGKCTVKLVVSNPRPTNGRVHVVAYAKGQEYFVDANGDGEFTTGESYDDVPQGVCLDKDVDGVCDAGEFIIGNSSAPDAGNASWDGSGTAYARLQGGFFFSVTSAAPRMFQYDSSTGQCTSTLITAASPLSVTMGTSSRQFVQFCVRDANTSADALGGNPVISGATVGVAATISTVSVAVSPSTVADVISGPTLHTVTVTNSSAPTPLSAGGSADLTFTMGGNVFTLLNRITINP